MAKIKVEVDKNKLQAAINTAEFNGPLSGRTVLWQEAATIYNAAAQAEGMKDITASVVYLRFKEMGLTCATPLGRVGAPMTDERKDQMRQALKNRQTTGVRMSRADKMAALPDAAEHFARLRKIVPEQYQGLVNRVEKGSLTAAIKLHCILCVGCEAVRVSINTCKGLSCPMYLHRPYQHVTDDDAADAEDAAEDADEQDAV